MRPLRLARRRLRPVRGHHRLGHRRRHPVRRGRVLHSRRAAVRPGRARQPVADVVRVARVPRRLARVVGLALARGPAARVVEHVHPAVHAPKPSTAVRIARPNMSRWAVESGMSRRRGRHLHDGGHRVADAAVGDRRRHRVARTGVARGVGGGGLHVLRCRLAVLVCRLHAVPVARARGLAARPS